MLLRYHSRNSMKILTLSAALILICICSYSQNLIGYKGKDILKYMKMNHSEMNNNKVINGKFSYLKYSDNPENQTVLFFLDTDSVCSRVRIIYDLSLKTNKLKELNSQFLKNGDNKWIDNHGGKTYNILLTEGIWSCTISIESEK